MNLVMRKERLKKQKRRALILAIITMLCLLSDTSKSKTDNKTEEYHIEKVEQTKPFVILESEWNKINGKEIELITSPVTEPSEEEQEDLEKKVSRYYTTSQYISNGKDISQYYRKNYNDNVENSNLEQYAIQFNISPMQLCEVCFWYRIDLNKQNFVLTSENINFLFEKYNSLNEMDEFASSKNITSNKVRQFFNAIDIDISTLKDNKLNGLDIAIYNFWEYISMPIYDFSIRTNNSLSQCLETFQILNLTIKNEYDIVNGIDFMIANKILNPDSKNSDIVFLIVI